MLVVMFSHEVADDVFDNGINSAVSCEKHSKKKIMVFTFLLFGLLFWFSLFVVVFVWFFVVFFFLSPFFSGIKNEVFTCSGVLPCCSCVC